MKTTSKPIMLSGIQPTNNLTLGNYLGSIKPYIMLQNKYKMFVFVADLHALTNNFDKNKLLDNKKNVVCSYYAAGLDFKKCIIFNQSDVISHNDVSHVLLCHTTLGELERMTQFKDKALSKSDNNTFYIRTGLLTYPVLMAADILLYDANAVIVGADQKQHLELTRNIAIRMNNKYGNMFVLPEPVIMSHAARVMDLLDPSIKMSKSNTNPKGVIFLSDPLDVIQKKIMQAKTDSLNKVNYDPQKQPGVSNLLEIYNAISNISIPNIVKKYANKNYADFKKDLAKLVCQEISAFQVKFKKANQIFAKQIKPILIKNAKICTQIVRKKTQLVYKKIGLI